MTALHSAIVAPLSGVATQRLTLRPLGREDLDELMAMFADREVWGFEYGRGLTRRECEAFLDRQIKLWDECGFGGCGVRESAQMDLVGVVGLAVPVVLPELLPAVTIGWRFSPTSWGKGYATEAATALLDQAFTPMGLDRVGCVTNAENRRSVAVAERLGMTIITETMVPSYDGTTMVAALLFEVARNHWLAVRAQHARTQLPFGADGSGTFRLASTRGMLMGDMCTLEFTRLTAELLPQVESWFDDPETIRFLGDRSWVRRALRLVDETPGKEYRGRTVLGRDVWVVVKQVPVGFIDVERYDDGRAECALVVAPAMRRQGIGRAILEAVWKGPELADVRELIGGVEPENAASRRCLDAAGFRLSSEPDEEGMLRGVCARPSHASS